MNYNYPTQQEYQQLLSELHTLPSGGITYKKINNKKYAYYQWSECGKQRSRRIKDDELELLSTQIERRKKLQDIIKSYNGFNNNPISSTNNMTYPITTPFHYMFQENISNYSIPTSYYNFNCITRTDIELDRFIKPVSNLKKRSCYSNLKDYIYSDISDKVFILYGLRRTGKTTLIRQLIYDMTPEDKAQTVFIQIQEDNTLKDVNQDLKHLEKLGYRYVFIDEVTLLEDFIEGAALFSDIFASSGMKIVLSGTDSLGFMFTGHEELYDRCIMCHTTFIPYREFEEVLGISGIDNYIRYGGTMSVSGSNYNATFSSKKTTDEYVNSAIARNIQHSLKNYQYENHFRSLRELYEKNELTSAINRIVEDINHNFTAEVLTRNFKSHDLRLSANNLRKDKSSPNNILDNIDIATVTKTLMDLLEIKNKDEQSITIEDAHATEIKEYLTLLDLIVNIEDRTLSNLNASNTLTVLTQPGIRYQQAEALITSLMKDDKFNNLSFNERKYVTNRILSEIKGRMLEEIVLLETKLALPHYDVFKLKFDIGEFDMVIADPINGSCKLYEIKYSTQVVSNQARHLLDEAKCNATEFRYGEILGKYILYNGESKNLNGIDYINVEDYLKSLGEQR